MKLLETLHLFCLLVLPYQVASCYVKDKISLLHLQNVLLPNNSNTNIYCTSDLDGSISPKLASWGAEDDVDCCSWEGVTCDEYLGRVVRLDLGCNPQYPSSAATSQRAHHTNGNGTQGSNFTFFRGLTALEVLIFDGLDMSGTDLSFLMDLPLSLKVLSLHSCQLLGVIPETIFYLPNLQFLDLSYNQYLSGNLPLLKWNNPNLNTLDLSSTSFSGKLPDSIESLESLEILWLGNCNFSGFIPVSISKLSRLLRVDLSFNRFTGRIPYSLSRLYQLQYLSLSSNALGGSIPNIFTNMTQLESLDFSNNNLVRDLRESSLLSIPSLKRLDLSGNQLSGTLDEFTAAKLVKINLSGNKFQGQIPAAMFKLGNLTVLRISSNRLTGIKGLEILSELQTLKILDLSHNLLSVSNISSVELSIPNLQWLGLSWNNLSEFPVFLKSSKDLNWLDLSGNGFVGRAPDWIWEVGSDSLSYLNLSHNSLQSFEQIPWRNLMYLDLSSNMIQGEIPTIPASSQILLGFFMSSNNLTGGIPSWICSQQSMQYLVLSKNSLSGMIPQCLSHFSKNLEVLDLKENRLSGTISYLSFEENNSLTSLHLSSNQLQGPLPQSLINCKQLKILDLGNNKLSDKFPTWLETLPSIKILDSRCVINKIFTYSNSIAIELRRRLSMVISLRA